MCRLRTFNPRDDVLVFVEVKARSKEMLDTPSASVNTSKQRRLVYTAHSYMRQLEVELPAARFDIVEVILNTGKFPQCYIIPQAFSLPIPSPVRK